MSINLTDLSADQLAALVAQVREADKAETAAKKAEREERKAARAATVSAISALISEELIAKGVPATTFKSGAVGWTLGGKDIEVIGADGSIEKVRVSMLVRFENTIPAKDDAAADAAEGSDED